MFTSFIVISLILCKISVVFLKLLIFGSLLIRFNLVEHSTAGTWLQVADEFKKIYKFKQLINKNDLS